jgi:hypothetical protein
MKPIIYSLNLPVLVVSRLVLANHEIKNEASKKSASEPLSAAEKKAA